MYKIDFGKRHIQYLLLFCGCLISYTIRASLSVAIIAMISKNPPRQDIKTYPEWENKDVILSAFFWGYAVFQIIGGYVGQKYGPKYILGVAFVITSIFTVLVPEMAQAFGSEGVIFSRVVQGASQGFLLPCTHSMLAKWTPLPERSRVVGVVYSTPMLGTTISMFTTGYICNSSYGWPMVFYLTGILGMLWSFFFLWVASNEPEFHRTISPKEKEYIRQNTSTTHGKTKISTPWKSIFTSLPVWAIVIAGMGINYGFWTLQTEIPSYMNSILKFDLTENSFLASLPFLTSFIVSLIVSPLADTLVSREILSLVNTRKCTVCIGAYGAGLALICIAYIPYTMRGLVVVMLVIAVAFNSVNLVGCMPNHMDIAPSFAGLLMGLANSAASLASISGPLVVQTIVTDQDDFEQWRWIFIIAASVYLVSGTFFLIFASGKVQNWNEGPKELSVKEKDFEKNPNGNKQ